MLGRQTQIHFIGDSHVQFFLGKDQLTADGQPMRGLIPFFKVHHLGPALAYNLSITGSQTRGREKLFSLLSTLPIGSRILLSFGEIDCRCHVPKRSSELRQDQGEIVHEIAHRYLSVVREVSQLGYKVAVLGPPPSAPDGASVNPEFPVFGSCRQRNAVISLFNDVLAQQLKMSGITFVTLFPHLVNNSLDTLEGIHFDGVHLSQKFMPLMIRLLRRQNIVSFVQEISYFYFFYPFVSLPYNALISVYRKQKKYFDVL